MKNKKQLKPHERLMEDGKRLKRLKDRQTYKRNHMNSDGTHNGTYKP